VNVIRLTIGRHRGAKLVRIEPYTGNAPIPAQLYDQRLQEQTA